MGTRHLTVIKDIDGEEICVIYGQFDGYPSGHGADLKNFLTGYHICNGYSDAEQKLEKCANGMGDLAMQLIGDLKYFAEAYRHRETEVEGHLAVHKLLEEVKIAPAKKSCRYILHHDLDCQKGKDGKKFPEVSCKTYERHLSKVEWHFW